MASAGEAAPTSGDGGAPNTTNTSSQSNGNTGNRGRGRGRGGRGRGRGDGSRGHGRGRGRGGNSSHANGSGSQPEPVSELQGDNARPAAKIATFKARTEPQDDSGDADAEVCFICANPVIHYSIATCNHLTCHVCALRLRALYKTKDCPHCRTAAPFVIFTDDSEKKFDQYTSTDITSTDDNIGIRYANEDIVGDTILLLRYNCPDPSCDFAGLGWPDLHRHVRAAHHKKMCDLCTRNKKVFTHEHDMFSDKELQEHMRRGDDKPGAVDQTGFRGHPLCSFCGERFYDGDKLYEHCRNKHERCFICDRRDSRQPHYYLDYNALEEHFKKDHYLCLDKECLEKKFVVFESEMDLKAHQLSEHANSLSKDVRRDARLVDMSGFDFRSSYQQERRGGGSARESRGRGRDPNAELPPPTSAQSLRRDEIAFHRQMAIHSAQSVSNRTFGGQLTSTPTPARTNGNNASSSASASSPALAPAPASAQQPLIDAMENVAITDLSTLTPEQRASMTRHGAVIERASNLLGNEASKMATFRSYISSYNRNSMTAEQLIDAFFALFADTSSNALGTLIREVADLFDDKRKSEALRKTWQNWRAINEDYPSLPGLGGMHGATTSSSGWAAAAAASPTTIVPGARDASGQSKHSTRVLRLKNSTRSKSNAGLDPATMPNSAATVVQGGPGPSSSGRAPPPSSAFPALPSAAGSSRAQSQPSWLGGGTGPAVHTTASRVAAGGSLSYAPPSRRTGAAVGGGSRAGNNDEAFPALPAAPKPLTTIFGYGTGSVRRDFGGGRDTGFSWGGSSSAGASGSAGAAGGADDEAAEPEGGGKGKKKGKKQVLIQWG